jgi:hypothetical protein
MRDYVHMACYSKKINLLTKRNNLSDVVEKSVWLLASTGLSTKKVYSQISSAKAALIGVLCSSNPTTVSCNDRE